MSVTQFTTESGSAYTVIADSRKIQVRRDGQVPIVDSSVTPIEWRDDQQWIKLVGQPKIEIGEPVRLMMAAPDGSVVLRTTTLVTEITYVSPSRHRS